MTTAPKVTENVIAPPEHLSRRAKDLWMRLAPKEARSTERRTLFQTALECLDRADQARELIAAAGLTSTTKSTGAIHIHPLVKVEHESRAQFVKIWNLLGLKINYKLDRQS